MAKWNLPLNLSAMTADQLKSTRGELEATIADINKELSSRASTTRSKAAEQYARQKEKQDRIGKVMQVTLKLGDIVKVMGSTSNAPGVVVALNRSSFEIKRISGYGVDPVMTTKITEHGYNKITHLEVDGELVRLG